MKREYCVYIHRNKINSKVYVGMTRNLELRWRDKGSSYKGRGYLFGNAIDKYGWDGFDHEVIKDDLTYDEALLLEEFFIALYKSNVCRYNNPSYGYNLTDGGDGVKGHKHDAKARENIKAGVGSPEALAKIHNAHYGKKRSYDATWSETARANHMKAIEKSKGKRISGRPVRCDSTGEVFANVRDAANKLGIPEGNISRCALRTRKTANGLIFSYLSKEEIKKYFPNDRTRPIMCVEKNIIYDDIDSIPYMSKNDKCRILGCCRGKFSTCCCCHWRFASDDEYAV